MAAGSKRGTTRDWNAIKAGYLAGLDAPTLAAKYNVPVATLKSRASREKWGEQRNHVATQVQRELPDAIARAEADRAATSGVMSAAEVLEELSRIARGGMHKVAEWGAAGVILKESSGLEEEDRALVAEVSETRTDKGGSLRIKVFDRLTALDKLARHYGLYSEKEGGKPDDSSSGGAPSVSSVEELRHLDPSELDRRIGEALRASKRSRGQS